MERLTLVYIVIGLIIAGVVALKPKLFWPMLIVAAVGTAGLILPQYRIPLVDEYFIGCVLIGGLLAISVRLVSPGKREGNDWDRLHILVFSLMIVYMLVQTIRGLLLWEDLRLSRWIIYYIMLGMLSLILYRGYFPVPNVKRISMIILWSALLYYIVYWAQGFYAEEVIGISRFATQGIEWSGTSYAMFPLVVAIPAAILLFRDRARSQRWVGWAVIILILLLGIFYDSRTAWISTIAFFVISPTALRLRQTTMWLLIFMGLFLILFHGQAAQFLQRLGESAALQDPNDAGRLLHSQAAFNAVIGEWTTLLFGYGVHSHHFVLGPYLNVAAYPFYVYSTSFAGILVDTGLIGILLLVMNYLIVARNIFAPKKSPFRFILLLALLLPVYWILIIDLDDIMLFYLMIMPSGLLVQLSRYEEAEQGLEKQSPNIVTREP